MGHLEGAPMSHPIQEEDRIATGKIVLTAICSLIIFGIGALWAVSIQRSESKSVVIKAEGPTEAGKPEVGIVYQWPFFVSHFGQDKLEVKRQLLSSYGWVDKNAQVVHIPIDEAMKKYVATAGGQK